MDSLPCSVLLIWVFKQRRAQETGRARERKINESLKEEWGKGWCVSREGQWEWGKVRQIHMHRGVYQLSMWICDISQLRYDLGFCIKVQSNSNISHIVILSTFPVSVSVPISARTAKPSINTRNPECDGSRGSQAALTLKCTQSDRFHSAHIASHSPQRHRCPHDNITFLRENVNLLQTTVCWDHLFSPEQEETHFFYKAATLTSQTKNSMMHVGIF